MWGSTMRDANRLFARRLRTLRTTIGVSQAELAERAGLSTDAVGRLERGVFSPTLRVLVQLAKGLDTDVAALVTNLVPVEMTKHERALLRALRGIVQAAR